MDCVTSEWGFFQVTGHGVGRPLLEEMRREQARLFQLLFNAKEKAGLLNGSYRWDNPTAVSLRQVSWSDAFHVPMSCVTVQMEVPDFDCRLAVPSRRSPDADRDRDGPGESRPSAVPRPRNREERKELPAAASGVPAPHANFLPPPLLVHEREGEKTGRKRKEWVLFFLR
ncbi:hypothetical protein ACQ4PT_045994 [Festuca glaucescens]